MADSAEEMLALEAKVLDAAAGPYLVAVEELRTLLVTEPDKVRRRVLALTPPKVRRSTLALLASAATLGLADAARSIGEGGPKVKAGVRSEVVAEVRGLSSSSAKAVRQAQALASAGAPPAAALALLFADQTHVKRTLTSAVNSTRNDAVVMASKAAEVPMTLIAERDACVHCLRHQGEVTVSGDFPPGLTYGGKPLKTSGRQRCPIHPNCRCRLVPLNSPDFAAALRREADRSVLRGFSLPSESPKARIDAADRLLKSGVNAPASVKTLARRAVRDGKFPDRATPSSARR